MFLFIPLISFGQIKLSVYPDFEILGKDTINRIIDHQKQGEWVYYLEGLEHISCFISNFYHGKTADHIKSKGNYLNGNKVGLWEMFFKNKDLKQTVFYNREGEKDGTSIEYFPNGKIKSEQVWKKDNLISQIVFFENGHKKFESEYSEGQINFFIVYYNSGKPKFQGELFPSMKIKELMKSDENGKTTRIKAKRFGNLMVEEGLLGYL